MTDDFDSDDELQRRLNSLYADTAGIQMAGPDAARRRAAQRTRNQVTTGVLASIAVLAIGAIGVTQDNLFTAPEPAHPTDTRHPTVSPTTPDAPDETGDPSPPDGERTPPGDGDGDGDGDGANIPADAFLTIGDITPEGEEGDVFAGWDETDTSQTPFDCAPAAPDDAAYVAYQTDDDGHLLQFIEETDDPVARFSQIRAEFERCVREAGERDRFTGFSQIWNVGGVGDEAWMATYFDEREEPSGDVMETDIVYVQMVRVGDHVSVVVDGGPGLDDNFDMDPQQLVTSAERLCAALGTECVGELSLERSDREPLGDVDGWLTLDGVVEATGLEEIVEGSEPMEGNEEGVPPGWALTYLPLDPESDGATFFQRRFYRSANPGDLSIDQEIAEFPDAESARAHYEDMVAAAESYNEGGRDVEGTGSSEADGRAISTWREEDQEFGITFVFGIALQGNTVTVVNHGIDSAGDHDITADQMMDLLTRAADRLSKAR